MSRFSSNRCQLISHPLAVAVVLTVLGTAAPAFAGSTCQLLDASSNDAGDGGADAGSDTGGNASSLACGEGAAAPGAEGTSIGTSSRTSIGGTAVGVRAIAAGNFNTAIGNNANAGGQFNNIAIGARSTSGNFNSTAVGTDSRASGVASTAAGSRAQATGDFSAAFGGLHAGLNDQVVPERSTRASGRESSAFGSAAHADAIQSSAFGFGSVVLNGADRAAALGTHSVANTADTVSFGHGATDLDFLGVAFGSEYNRRLVHIADGINDTDAVNVRQLNTALATVSGTDLTPVAAALGGGASWSGGMFGSPSYAILGSSYNNVGDAFAAINNWMQGNGNGVQYDDPSRSVVTLQGAGGTQVGNVADGVADSDAVNKGQMDAGDAATLSAANTYADAGDAVTLSAANTYADAGDVATLSAANAHADAGDAATLSEANVHADAGDAATLTSARSYADTTATTTLHSANAYTDARFAAWDDNFTRFRDEVDQRFSAQDRRIDRIGAMGGAMSAAAMNTAGLAGNNRLGVGIGSQGGQAAMAIGYQRLVRSNVSVSLSAGFADDESSVSAGAGFSW